jgi:predicted RNase H-like HicB family nuclease
MMKQIYNAIITEEDGGYVALNPDTGVASQGSTVDESVANLQEALSLYLHELKDGAPVTKKSFLTTFSL